MIALIKVSWSPFAEQCHIEKMKNIHNIKNRKISYIVRAVTFDGPASMSKLSNN